MHRDAVRLACSMAALAAVSACASGQTVPSRDPMVAAFADFWGDLAAGGVACGANSAALKWEQPDGLLGGSARLAKLSGEALSAAMGALRNAPRPTAVNSCPAALTPTPSGAGLTVCWLRDEWRVEVAAEARAATEMASLPAVAVAIAERLDRRLPGRTDARAPTNATQGSMAASGPQAVAGAEAERIVVCRDASGVEPQGVAEAFDRADVLYAVVDIGVVAAGDQLEIAWQRGDETLMQCALPTAPGLNRLTVKLDMTASGGFAAGQYAVQLLRGGGVVARRAFAVGPVQTTADASSPGEGSAGGAEEGGPSVMRLLLSDRVPGPEGVEVGVWSFAATSPVIYATFRYRGFPPDTTLQAEWLPPGGGPGLVTQIVLEADKGTAAFALMPPPGGVLTQGKWTLAIRPEPGAEPLVSRRFTIE